MYDISPHAWLRRFWYTSLSKAMRWYLNANISEYFSWKKIDPSFENAKSFITTEDLRLFIERNSTWYSGIHLTPLNFRQEKSNAVPVLSSGL